jgi:hypothetical protein
LRLLAGLVLLDTARILLKGRVTMEEILFTLTRLWPIKPLTGHHESRDREPLAEIACTLPRE